MWRYNIYGKDNKLVRASDYIYETEELAMAAAAEYVKRAKPSDETWHTVASRK